MDTDRAREIAVSAGLGKLDNKHLDQLVKSIASTRELGAKLPKDLHWSEEIALAFRLPTATSAKR
jgi:hypothetical protein